MLKTMGSCWKRLVRVGDDGLLQETADRVETVGLCWKQRARI